MARRRKSTTTVGRNGDGATALDNLDVPDGWQLTRLKDQVVLKNGSAYNADDWKTSGVPIIRIQNLKDSGSPFNYFQGDVESKVPVRNGDLLFSWSGSKGTSFGPHLWNGELAVLNQHIFKVIINSNASIEKSFLYYALKHLTARIEEKAYGLAALVHVRKGDLEATPVPLPPLAEQRAIAGVLRTVERAKRQTEQVLSAVRELKQSLMRHLFTYGPVPVHQTDQVELKETEAGSIPVDWEAVQIGNIVTQTQYGLSKRGERAGTYPILRMNNPDGGRITTNDLQFIELPADEFAKFRVNVGDVLFNRTNSYELVGKTAMFDLPGEYVFASYLIRAMPDTVRVCPAYLNYYLNVESTQARLKQLATRAVSQSNINATKLRGFTIPLPPRPVQDVIAETLAAVDTRIASEATNRDALDALFKTLLHKLMTGRLRVNQIDVSALAATADSALKAAEA